MVAERKPKDKGGVSLRKVHLWLIVGVIIISGAMFYFTFHLSASFYGLTETSEQQIRLRKAARELMDASDYLTERVQRFTVDGDMRFLDEYFTEAFESLHREEAINTMSSDSRNAAALQQLQEAMDASLELMDREYYAMRLVIEAKGYASYPEALRSVELSAADRALSPEDKMRLATQMVLDETYYQQKETIRENMKASLDELEAMAYDADASALTSLQSEMLFVRSVIVLQIIVVFLTVFLTASLGIQPVIRAVDQIKEGSPIPEVGANEFRYLARTYNKMYEVYKSSLERLNFKASHDALTGAYNRSGYELILSGLDLASTYMILFDIDNFKEINDTYGHDVGDRVLARLVQVLKNIFRSDDYICRVGGDEFVVLMVHATANRHKLIAAKVDRINRELAETSDGLPAASISVGIAHGSKTDDADSLFKRADLALYHSKQAGKHTYTFQSG